MTQWNNAIGRIGDPVLRDLAAAGRIRRFPKGSLIMREHEPGRSLFVLLAGRVRVFVSDARGRQMTLCHYGPQNCVGEMALDGQPRSASVLAQEATVCAEIDWDQLRSAIAARPEIALRLLATAIARGRSATGSLKDLALLDVYGRVARLLCGLEVEADAEGLPWSRERLTQRDIAQRVGASRDMVARILKDLRAGGYIEIRAKRFRIVRRPPSRW